MSLNCSEMLLGSLENRLYFLCPPLWEAHSCIFRRMSFAGIKGVVEPFLGRQFPAF